MARARRLCGRPGRFAFDPQFDGYDMFDVPLGDLMRGERATLGKSLLDVERELRIRATYIAAIENGDIDAFQSAGFIAGYVRSYARYLGMDTERTFQRFCEETGFRGVHGGTLPARTPSRLAEPRRCGSIPMT
jgi:cytoskeletal protein RodZ